MCRMDDDNLIDKQQVKTLGLTTGGELIKSVDITNGVLSARLLSYGAALQDLRLAPFDHSLVLGWPTLRDYEACRSYIGVAVGRYANRIAKGAYAIDGRAYRTDRNFLDKHTLHGGQTGMDKMIWRIVSLSPNSVTFGLSLEDGHMGFGGDLDVTLKYSIEEQSTLAFIFTARTSQTSLCNLSQHTYFNLDGGGDIRSHQLSIAADHYTPVDAELIPTGEVCDVSGTPFDFRELRAIGDYPYDHNFCLAKQRLPCRGIATLISEKTGITMELETTEPGLQIYSGACLDAKGSQGADGGLHYGPHAGIALEPQIWPDAPNQHDFPVSSLNKGETYQHISRYVFKAHSA